jgi:hypothetical protein
MKALFKLIYPDNKLENFIYILPKSTGIQIQGNKMFLYIWIINLSYFYNMKIKLEKASIDGDNYELKHTLNGVSDIIVRRYSIMEDVRLEGELDEKQKDYFLKEPINRYRKHLNMRIKITIKNCILGDREIEEKTFETFDILMEYPK